MTCHIRHDAPGLHAHLAMSVSCADLEALDQVEEASELDLFVQHKNIAARVGMLDHDPVFRCFVCFFFVFFYQITANTQFLFSNLLKVLLSLFQFLSLSLPIISIASDTK